MILLIEILDLITNNLCINKRKASKNRMFLSTQQSNPSGRKWMDNFEEKKQRPNSAQNIAEPLKENYERKFDNGDLELAKHPIDEVPEEMFQTNMTKLTDEKQNDDPENKDQNEEYSLDLNNMEPIYSSDDKIFETKNNKNNRRKSIKPDSNHIGRKRKSRSKNKLKKSSRNKKDRNGSMESVKSPGLKPDLTDQKSNPKGLKSRKASQQRPFSGGYQKQLVPQKSLKPSGRKLRPKTAKSKSKGNKNMLKSPKSKHLVSPSRGQFTSQKKQKNNKFGKTQKLSKRNASLSPSGDEVNEILFERMIQKDNYLEKATKRIKNSQFQSHEEEHDK